jgi:hypothetical protein
MNPYLSHTLNSLIRRTAPDPVARDGAEGSSWPVDGPAWEKRVKVLSAAQDGANKRWTYSVQEVGMGLGASFWAAAFTPFGAAFSAFNLNERANLGATGMNGNGIMGSNLTGTFDLKPVPPGAIVIVEWFPRLTVLGGALTGDWVITRSGLANGVDGACPT